MTASATLSGAPGPNLMAELALVGSIAGRREGALGCELPGRALRAFWSASRTLQQMWMSELSQLDSRAALSAGPFERIALELFLTELLTRVWATNWTIPDRAHGRRDAERILTNVLRGQARVRREVLLAMVGHWDGESSDVVSRLDRFRRRSERWTDLLIAGPAILHGVWDYAVEPTRARDFGLENWSVKAGEANPATLLVSAGLRVMFGTHWPTGCCRSEPFSELLSALRSTLPKSAFHADGTLKPAGEWAMN